MDPTKYNDIILCKKNDIEERDVSFDISLVFFVIS